MMIELAGVSASYGDAPVVERVDFALAPGELVAITGPNGVGKSTLARVLCAAQLADDGRVTVDGHDPAVSERERLCVRELVGYVQQDPADQIVSSLVEDEAAFGPRNLGFDDAAVARRVAEALGAAGLDGFEQRVTTELSGGEQQRLALAGVLAMHPRYLVLDEPCAQLDPEARASMRELFVSLVREQGLGVALITHDPLEIVLADRVFAMGECEGDEQIAAPFEASAGQTSAAFDPQAPALLSMRGVAFAYGERPVLRGIDLDVRAGEIVLLTGASGAGKSTLAALAAGLVEPDAGTVTVCGAPAAPGRVGCVFQNPESQFFLDTVYDELAFAPRNRGVAEREVEARVRRATEQTGLDTSLWERYPFELSGGQARRVALASVLTLDASVYVLDEPTANLDAQGRAAIRALVRTLAANGTGVVVISHDVDEWMQLASRVLRLENGTLSVTAPTALQYPAEGAESASAPQRIAEDPVAANTHARARTKPLMPAMGYTPDASLSRMDPRVKIVVLLAVSVALFVGQGLVHLAVWCAALACCLAAARLSPASIVRGMRPVVIVLALTLLANLVSCDGSAVIPVAGPLGINPAGGLRGLTAVVRIMLLVGFALAVATTTTATQIARACTWLLGPLAHLGVPVPAIGLALSLALRCIPLVAEEFSRIRLAQRARAAHLDEGGLMQRIRAWVSVLMPLIAGLFRRADALGEAMAARCYGARDGLEPSRGRDVRA